MMLRRKRIVLWCALGGAVLFLWGSSIIWTMAWQSKKGTIIISRGAVGLIVSQSPASQSVQPSGYVIRNKDWQPVWWFEWRRSALIRKVVVPLWPFLLLVLVAAGLSRGRRHARESESQCRKCGYLLIQGQSMCPECGQPLHP